MAHFDFRDLFRSPTPQERIDALQLRADLGRAAVALVADERVDVQVARLAALLEPGESVVLLIEGRSERRMGLAMLSTRRVLFRPHGESSSGVTVLPLADVSSVESDVRSMTGRVVLRSSAVALEVDKILGKLADQFAAAVRTEQQTSRHWPLGRGTDAANSLGGPRDPLAELVELRERHAAGLVSTAEYEAAKARLVQEI